ncbi:hypothetical protein P872_13880 [Rhodonellum psychrophilum GCM71 = DSM 17998]|uniref:Uncharacterized protein n=2 Tax=Rhodonellum TaxID=336827 RepID=U5BWL8_9BACT|nr:MULTISPECIES: hypothetical protein [Rhodonellum]ERM80317.1 hypothetical protein P872_13880 [Rhodonellum psychrophilum GCM71 = DSM 17998]SDZ58899.1 hypothetical protein SAMN05444412_1378 [Rhodonellum ikkaensis]
MKLKFEFWVETVNSINDDAKVLFVESIVCYKAGAYRASLLLSYLAFATSLKHRVLTADKPIIFPQGLWDSHLKKVRNEDVWESAIFDLTQLRVVINQDESIQRSPVFTIPNSLRDEIKYWKDRRNECAHNKGSLILQSHVEVFWAFLQSNLGKITVEGGIMSLIQKIQKHYDVNFTPKGKDVTPLINEIESVVPKDDIRDFLMRSFAVIHDSYQYLFLNNEILDYIDKLLISGNQQLITTFSDFIKNEESFLQEYLKHNPNFVNWLGLTAEDVRNFWKTRLSKYSNPLEVYAALLRNSLIPKDEIGESNLSIISFLKHFELNEETYIPLKRNRFYDCLSDYLFSSIEEKSFNWINSNSFLFKSYFQTEGFDESSVNFVSGVLRRDYSPFSLENRLEELFSERDDLKESFLGICSKLGIEVPSQFQ